MGAIASGGVRVLDDDVLRWYRIPASSVEQVARAEQIELERRERAYRGARAPAAVEGKIVILGRRWSGDRIVHACSGASRATAHAGVDRCRLPVGAPESCHALTEVADEVVCALAPPSFRSVGSWYDNFDQTADEEVTQLLTDAGSTSSSGVHERR